MEGAGEADLYVSVAKQVEAAGGRANFSNAEIRAEFGLSQREYDRIGEAVDLIEPELRQALTLVSSTVDDENPPLSVIFDRWKLERKPPAKTVSDFGTYVRRFREINGDVPIRNINAAHIEAQAA